MTDLFELSSKIDNLLHGQGVDLRDVGRLSNFLNTFVDEQLNSEPGLSPFVISGPFFKTLQKSNSFGDWKKMMIFLLVLIL